MSDKRQLASLRSRRLEVVGTRKNGRARRRHACLPRARQFSLSLTTSKRLLRRLAARMHLYQSFSRFFSTRHEQEKSQGASESTELRRRIKQLEEENEEMSDNRLQLIGILLTKWSRLTYCLTANVF